MGCAQVTSLNLKKHEFGKIPTRIVWLQIAGLSPEHIALLKFSDPNSDKLTAFENSLCVGSTWEYDLYNIRPRAYAGFMSQMTGKKNIKNTCSDYDLKPIWKYVAPKGYKIGIFESEMLPTQSLTKALDCKKHQAYLSDTILWTMNKDYKTKNSFHSNDRVNYKKGKIYFDKSCAKGDCYSTMSKNVEGTFSQFKKNTNNFVYIVRNFKFANLLKKKDIKGAKAELNEINATINYFQKIAKSNSNMLVLVTSSNSLDLNFPKSGKQWKKFERGSKNLKINHSKLVSSVFATGARAENFCGIYGQSQILSRIFSGAKQQGLEFSIINPFNN